MTASPAAVDAAAHARRRAFHTLRVAAVEQLTDDALTITFELPDPLQDEYRFTAGQHLSVRVPALGDDVRRSYSLCTPATSGVLKVGVKLLPDGVFSGYASRRLAPGDPVDVMTPAGRFSPSLDPTHEKHYCAIAAGSGITPILSILATVLELEPASRCTLLYGNRSTPSIMFLEELEDLKDRFPDRLVLVHVLSREGQDAELLCGRLDAERLPRLLDAFAPVVTVDEWFLCGPEQMIDGARTLLVGLGVDPARVHRELFHTGPGPVRRRADPAPAAGASTVTITLDRRTSSFPLAADGEPVLDALLRVRADAPYACRNGMCGTCRAKVVSGTVEMEQNYALEATEVTDGFVLACQSHPTSGSVTLDFDA